MSKCSIDHLTISMAGCVLCLVVASALAGNIRFSHQAYYNPMVSTYKPRTALTMRPTHFNNRPLSRYTVLQEREKRQDHTRYNSDACMNKTLNGCTFALDPNDNCTSWINCSTGMSQQKLRQAGCWATYNALMARFDLNSIPSATANISISIYGVASSPGIPIPYSNHNFYNHLVLDAVNISTTFLQCMSPYNIHHFVMQANVKNCGQFMSSDRQPPS